MGFRVRIVVAIGIGEVGSEAREVDVVSNG